ncbi:FAD-dependent oxidoreductase [Candidatus Daviesbacteria bacterium]|nr:FAD-dependent oxidoreductase [Candidatus Daviesbacteria bacterium]
MKVAIIGAGFCGLAAGYQLAELGHQVTIFEKEAYPGGLAVGFYQPGWQWPLEKHYHHFFTSDHHIINLAQKVGVAVDFLRPKTSVLVKEAIYQFDSPWHLLRFDKISFVARFQTGLVLAFLKIWPFWQNLEKYSAAFWLKKYLGASSDLIWQPLLAAKFGPYQSEVAMSWFWARIKKRSVRLGYPQQGFGYLAQKICQAIKDYGGNIRFNTAVTQIKSTKKGVQVDGHYFDRVIVTLPGKQFAKMAALPKSYLARIDKMQALGSVNLILEMEKPFLTDGTYWLNICNAAWPFLAVVDHTNMIDPSHYHGHHLVYISNYLPQGHEYFFKTAAELLDAYHPYLLKLNANYQKFVVGSYLVSAPFTQPVYSVGYSDIVLPHQTPMKNVYLANMEQIYPWDRGTNYAVEQGYKIASIINSEHAGS